MFAVRILRDMNEKVPPGDWVTVTEACELVADVSRRRIQALGKRKTVKSVIVLGRMLLDRAELIAWRDGPRAGGRPKKDKDAQPPKPGKGRGRK